MARGKAVARFTEVTPTVDAHWRALILFGRNVASYKFALGRSLLELAAEERELVRLDELAVPFSRHVCRHLQVVDRQATSSSSSFLDACRQHNAGGLSTDDLIATTSRLGFNNVIDAFHVLDGTDSETRFFVDERATAGGIRLTDELHRLASTTDRSLADETESRWSLVEAAWELSLPASALTVVYDSSLQELRASDRRRRTALTGVRGALNGYQKGACFYCFEAISTDSADPRIADVDHVFAWSLGAMVSGAPVDGVWNLVLACKRCNGFGEKRDRPVHVRYVERLHRRNEYLIASKHPLRETLVAQTGTTADERASTLRRAHAEASVSGARSPWLAPDERPARF